LSPKTCPPSRASNLKIALRPAVPGDEALLRRIYASTREEELAQVPWSPAEKAAFLDMQFDAQHRFYHEHHAGQAFDIIEVDGEPAGRLYVARWPQEIRIVDIALLPEHRNRGVGTSLITALLEEAASTGRKVSIHVEHFNPAASLYRRLGFRMVSEQGPYPRWEAEPATDVASARDD
jgi:ribosomal protein S18 acetylase RimI-like enzyme